MEVFQTYAVERIDKKSLVQSGKMIAAMLFLDQSSTEITAEFPGAIQGPVDLCWRRCLRVYVDVCERALQSKTSVTGHQLIETPYRLAQSTSYQPPIKLGDIDLSGIERERLVSISYSRLAYINKK